MPCYPEFPKKCASFASASKRLNIDSESRAPVGVGWSLRLSRISSRKIESAELAHILRAERLEAQNPLFEKKPIHDLRQPGRSRARGARGGILHESARMRTYGEIHERAVRHDRVAVSVSGCPTD